MASVPKSPFGLGLAHGAAGAALSATEVAVMTRISSGGGAEGGLLSSSDKYSARPECKAYN